MAITQKQLMNDFDLEVTKRKKDKFNHSGYVILRPNGKNKKTAEMLEFVRISTPPTIRYTNKTYNENIKTGVQTSFDTRKDAIQYIYKCLVSSMNKFDENKQLIKEHEQGVKEMKEYQARLLNDFIENKDDMTEQTIHKLLGQNTKLLEESGHATKMYILDDVDSLYIPMKDDEDTYQDYNTFITQLFDEQRKKYENLQNLADYEIAEVDTGLKIHQDDLIDLFREYIDRLN